MTTLDDIRRICQKLPGAEGGGAGRFGFHVMVKGKPKGFIWSWAERVHPKKARVPNNAVMGVLVPSLTVKEIILGSDAEKFFTEPHYNGYPAVLVRLEAIEPDELEDLIIEAWRCRASSELLAQYEQMSS